MVAHGETLRLADICSDDTLAAMGDVDDMGEDRLRKAIRAEMVALRRSERARMTGLSPAEARERTLQRRRAWSACLQEGRAELAAMTPEIDRMLRLEDRFNAWQRNRRD